MERMALSRACSTSMRRRAVSEVQTGLWGRPIAVGLDMILVAMMLILALRLVFSWRDLYRPLCRRWTSVVNKLYTRLCFDVNSFVRFPQERCCDRKVHVALRPLSTL
jgi:hypothetical protein